MIRRPLAKTPARSVKLAIAMAVILMSGCASAVSAVLSADDLRQGFAGLQQLVGLAKSLPESEVDLPDDLSTPLAGTYRGTQVLGEDTIRFYIRTAANPTAPIVDAEGNVTGYVLAGIMAASLDSIEARADQAGARLSPRRGGRAMFFVEGTQPPTPGARALYPGAFLGQLARGESAPADRQAAELQTLQIDTQAPSFADVAGRGIPHELFGSVAEGMFSVRPNGVTSYEQDYQLEDGRALSLRFDRMSRTTLPAM